jgi:hypothetical protein
MVRTQQEIEDELNDVRCEMKGVLSTKEGECRPSQRAGSLRTSGAGHAADLCAALATGKRSPRRARGNIGTIRVFRTRYDKGLCSKLRSDKPVLTRYSPSLGEKVKELGSPIGGRSRSTDVSCEKNFFLFPFFLLAQCVIFRYAPLFSFSFSVGVGRTSHPSGSRPWEISKREFFPSRAINVPQKTVVPHRFQGYRIS